MKKENSSSSILQLLIENGMIGLDDVLDSTNKEKAMTTAIQKIHPYAITRTTDGRYTTYVPDKTKPNGRRQVRRKSETALHKYLLEFYNITDCNKELSLLELFEEWKSYKCQFINASNKKKSLSQNTIRRYERDFDKYLKDTTIANTYIHKIAAPTLQSALRDIIVDNKMNEKCAGNIIGYISQMFQYAYQNEYVDKNVSAKIDKRLLLAMCVYVPPKSDEDRILSDKEMTLLHSAILRHEHAHPFYMPDYAIELAELTGMRVGELSALHWSDIFNGDIHIDYSEHRIDYADKKAEYFIGEPKNGKHRKFPITNDISNLLEKIHQLNLTSNEDYIFVRQDGSRYTSHDISCAIARRSSEAGIKKASIHCVRRTVSSALNTLLPQKEVASLLGHSERVNEQHYNFSRAERNEKIKAITEMSSKVINFTDYNSTKKIAKTL